MQMNTSDLMHVEYACMQCVCKVFGSVFAKFLTFWPISPNSPIVPGGPGGPYRWQHKYVIKKNNNKASFSLSDLI